MLSPPDLLIIGAAALIFFGPDQLPKVARRAGQVMREVQNTSQSFIREMERAADQSDPSTGRYAEPETMSPPYEYRSYAEPSPAPAPPAADSPVRDAGVHDSVAHENASGI